MAANAARPPPPGTDRSTGTGMHAASCAPSAASRSPGRSRATTARPAATELGARRARARAAPAAPVTITAPSITRWVDRWVDHSWVHPVILPGGGMLAQVARAWVGTSGWRYPPWRRTFYPAGLAQRRELEHLSRRRRQHRDQRVVLLAAAAGELPRLGAPRPRTDFVFAVKGGALHHPPEAAARRADPAGQLLRVGRARARPEARARCCGSSRRGCASTADRLAEFLALLPRTTAAAAELAAEHDERLDGPGAHRDRRRPPAAARPRGPARELPATRRSSRCSGRTASRSSSRTRPARGRRFDDVTAGLRLRAPARRTTSSTPAATRRTPWTRGRRPDARPGRAEGLDVVVYFDNDAKVHAPYDAIALAERLAGR